MLAATAVQQSQRVANSMTVSESELDTHDVDSDRKTVVLNTRFGRVEVDPDFAITMPRGLIGFPDQTRFALSDLADKRLAHLKALHCLDDEELSILVMPQELDSEIVDNEDIADALRALDMSPQTTSMLFVVATHRTADGTFMSVNLRAPIFVDVERQLATQHVLRNSKYPIRHPITKA